MFWAGPSPTIFIVKITYNWLKEYCDFKLSPEGLAEVLTGAGFVVAGMRATLDGDHVLEIEVTSNRPDCLGVIGIAREVAALTGTIAYSLFCGVGPRVPRRYLGEA